MDERVWTDRPLGADEVLEVAGARIARRPLAAARLVSGDLDAAIAELSSGAPMVGLAEDIGAGDACLRIARDRALMVAWEPRDWPSEWMSDGVAASPADDLYLVLEIEGPGARDILSQLGGYVSGQASPSCAIRIAGGQTALLVRRVNAWLLFVEHPSLASVTTWLRGCVAVRQDPG